MQPPVSPSIHIPAADDAISSGAGSPRAALIAGLRSATERRHREQGHSPSTSFHLSPPLSPLPLPGNGHSSHSSRSSFSSLNGLGSGVGGAGGSPSHGPVSDSTLSVDHPYSIIYAKQQELLATSMLISQQQQRLQTALNQAAAGVVANGGGSAGGGLSPYSDMDQLSGTLGNLDLDPPLRAYVSNSVTNHPSYSHNYNGSGRIQSPSSQLFSPRNSFFNQTTSAYSDIYNQPTNFTSPSRPSSSASIRRLNHHVSPGIGYTSSPTFYNPSSENTTGSPSGFRRGHRKASSLSSMTGTSQQSQGPLQQQQQQQQQQQYLDVNSINPSYSFGSHGRTSSNLSQGPPGLFTPKKFTAGSINYEVPIRQPYGPPPLEELKLRGKEINFANMPNLRGGNEMRE